MKKRFILIFSFIFLLASAAANDSNITTITIKNARETNYKKNEEGQDCIVLEGSVKIIVEKNGNESEINAEHVTYNRATEMLFAQDNVSIQTKSSNSGGEKITASSLLLNTSTLEGVFDGGKVIQTQSDALNLPSGSTLIVFSDLFGKTGNNVITFKNSSLTFCDDENPHWHIDATRTWLLPGGEFAFFNALLYVGVVPVMYFPAFYYPKDELVFNPVFSYTPRAGYSLQTTTYVFGRKPLNSATATSSSSDNNSSDETSASESIKALYNFMKPTTLKEQIQEGIILHNLDEDYTGNTTNYVKVMGDWYSNLGYQFGLDGNLSPSKKYLTSLKFNLNLGFSKTVFKSGLTEDFYPFSPYTGLTYNDKSDFLGLKLPFRYAANIDLRLNKPISLTLSVPVYSDPFFSHDFLKNRYETMDWISYLLDNINGNEKKEGAVSEVSNFEWKLATSANPTIAGVLNPYITSISLNHNSFVNISSKTTEFTAENGKIKFNDDEYELNWGEFTPSKKFFYPSSVTPVSSSVSVSGTIFSWPLNKKNYKSVDYVTQLNQPEEKTSEKTEGADESANANENLISGAENSSDEKSNSETAAKSYFTDDSEFTLRNTELSYDVPNVKLVDGFAYNLTYSVKGNFMNQYAYSATNLKLPSDFRWDGYRSYMYTVKTPVTLSSNASYGGNFLSVTNSFTYSPVFQDHPYISEKSEAEGGYSENSRKSLILADYNAEAQDIINANTVTLKPFVYSSVFSESSLSWNITEKLFKRTFVGTIDEPEWKNETVDFADEKFVTTNSLTAVIACAELNKKLKQSLTLGAVMRPLLMQYTASVNFTFPYVSLTAGSGIAEVSKEDLPYEDKWKKKPFTQSLNINLFDSNLSFTENYTYNLEENYHDNLKLSLSAFRMLQVIYIQSYSNGYDFSKENGWTQRPEKEFIPYSLSFSFAPEKKTYYRWFNRVSFAPGLNMSLVADLRRSTDSYLTFSPSLSFKIHEFLEITFSSTSRNSVLYWYFHNEPGDLYSEWGGFPGNVVKDLVDSFNFGDDKKRSGSGFKLKSFELTASHDLHDWKMNMQLKIEPRLIKENGKKPYYDFNPYFTIGIIWNPMESIKTSIIDEYGEWKID